MLLHDLLDCLIYIVKLAAGTTSVLDTSDMTRFSKFGSFNSSISKAVINYFELGYLRLREVVIRRITVIKLAENDGGYWMRVV